MKKRISAKELAEREYWEAREEKLSEIKGLKHPWGWGRKCHICGDWVSGEKMWKIAFSGHSLVSGGYRMRIWVCTSCHNTEAEIRAWWLVSPDHGDIEEYQ